VITLMRVLPARSKLTTIAPTLGYDDAIMSVAKPGHPLPASRGAAVTISVLCADGGASRGWLRDGVRALAQALPRARYRELDGRHR